MKKDSQIGKRWLANCTSILFSVQLRNEIISTHKLCLKVSEGSLVSLRYKSDFTAKKASKNLLPHIIKRQYYTSEREKDHREK